MPRASKKEKVRKDVVLFDDDEHSDETAEEELPKDEAGRLKIKRRYEELLGNSGREAQRSGFSTGNAINKTIEGIYFICLDCKKICHNLDEGLVEDPNNVANLCAPCAKNREKTRKKGRAAA